MTDANFGSYDRAKWAISLWAKAATLSQYGLMTHFDPFTTNQAFNLGISSADLYFVTFDSGGQDGQLIKTGILPTDGNYHHLLVWFDSANGTAGNRIRIWYDGSEVSPTAETPPDSQVNNATYDIHVGATYSGGQYFSGLLYQVAFFSGSLPAIGDVYNAGSPKDISSLTGLYAYLDCAGNDPTSDGALGTNWTNNNSVTTSTDIPT